MTKRLKITQIRSLIGSQPKHRLTMKALGFHRMHETLEKADTPQIRGMVQQVRHMVRVEEVDS
jgi:large subunit ribosomal protein L30